MKEYLSSNRFDAEERIFLSRELTFLNTELNELEDIIRLSSDLNISPLPINYHSTGENPENMRCTIYIHYILIVPIYLYILY